MPHSSVGQVEELCADLASPQARTKYGSARRLIRLSEQDPDLLYPRFDFFAHLMEGEARILRWNSSRILANLARADREGRIEQMLDRYLAPITGHELIAAANTIGGAAEIALAKPHLADRIAAAILKVRRARYATPECRNVAIAHALRAFDRFLPYIRDKAPVFAFVKRQLTNPRPATRKRAQKFCAKWWPGRKTARV